MNETEFQKQVTDTLTLFGWKFLHVRKSIGKKKQWVTATNIVGWPDILAWNPMRGFVALELKVGRNVLTDEQREVLISLAEAGAKTMVLYPEDFDAFLKLIGGKKAVAK